MIFVNARYIYIIRGSHLNINKINNVITTCFIVIRNTLYHTALLKLSNFIYVIPPTYLKKNMLCNACFFLH